eukprot:gene48732-59672_t
MAEFEKEKIKMGFLGLYLLGMSIKVGGCVSGWNVGLAIGPYGYMIAAAALSGALWLALADLSKVCSIWPHLRFYLAELPVQPFILTVRTSQFMAVSCMVSMSIILIYLLGSIPHLDFAKYALI